MSSPAPDPSPGGRGGTGAGESPRSPRPASAAPGLGRLGQAGDGTPSGLFDGVGARRLLLDSGLPALIFVVVYTFGGQQMGPSLALSLGAGAVLGLLRLRRRDSLQNVLAGLIGLGISAVVAARTGRAEDIFLPGLLINVAYGLAYVVSIAVRWPLLGVFVALALNSGMGWRRDPVLLRAYTVASWLWVAMFVVRLAVKVPLYLAGEDKLVALGVVNVVTGWPLFFLCLWLSYLVIERARRRAAGASRPA